VTTPIAVPPTPHPLGSRDLNRLRVIESIYRHPARVGPRSPGAPDCRSDRVGPCRGTRQCPPGHEQDAWRRQPQRAPAAADLLSLVPRAAFAVRTTSVTSTFGHVSAIWRGTGPDEWSRAQVERRPPRRSIWRHDLSGGMRKRRGAPEQLLGVGIGVAAPINRRTGHVESDGIMPGWRASARRRDAQPLVFSIQLANDRRRGRSRREGVRRGRVSMT